MILYHTEINAGQPQVVELKVANLPTRMEISIPVTVYDSGIEGPTVLFMAGLHGDEINGIEIIRRFIEQEHYVVERGAVICVPILNIFGFLHFSREVPDGKDVNRSFPGSPKGSLAAKVAHILMKEIAPLIDYGVDFHTGGNQINNQPQIRTSFEEEQNVHLAQLFQAPLTINSKTIKNSLRWAAAQKNKHILVFEGGESMRFCPYAIQEGIHGALRLLQGLGMKQDAPVQQKKQFIIRKRKWLRCTDSGLWILNCVQGQLVQKGDLLGYTTGPFGDFHSYLYAPHDGVIISINYMSVVNQGDALIHLGRIETDT